jgi:hypothetical protein
LHATSIPHQDYISKKKPSADPFPPDGSNPKDKLFAGEALGMVMISQGEDMLRNSVGDRQYAERLEKFGRARCKIAMVSSRSLEPPSYTEIENRLRKSTPLAWEKAISPGWRTL